VSGLVGYPLVLIGVFGIGPGGASVRDQVLPVGVMFSVFAAVLTLAAIGLWRRSVVAFRAVVAAAAAAALIQVVPIGADLASRIGISLLFVIVIAWLARPSTRRLFGHRPGFVEP
jgi:hypothetical protein